MKTVIALLKAEVRAIQHKVGEHYNVHDARRVFDVEDKLQLDELQTAILLLEKEHPKC